jgi:uncharacterized oxidoreductase
MYLSVADVKMPLLSAQQLRNLGAEIFEALGAPKKEAKLVSSLLVEANLTGFDSHGIIRLPNYVKSIKIDRKSTRLNSSHTT